MGFQTLQLNVLTSNHSQPSGVTALPAPQLHLLSVQLWRVPWSLEQKRLQSLMPWLHLSELVSSCTRFGCMATSFEAFRTSDLSIS
jgi:hypothetical protein